VATPEQAAAEIRNVGKRLVQQAASHGWNQSQPFSTVVSWQGPPFAISEFINWLGEFSGRVEAIEKRDITPLLQAAFDALPQRIAAIEPTIANMASDPMAPFSSISMVMQWIDDVLPQPAAIMDWSDLKGTDLVPQDLRRRLKSVEARLKELEPLAGDIGEKIDRINDARDAALALPTDLQELRDAKLEIDTIAEGTKKAESQATAHLSEVTALLEKIRKQDGEAAAIITKCEQAFGIATTVGLAGSFTSRARWITVAAWVWVVGLVVALGAGFWIGKLRFETLQTVLAGNSGATAVWVNVLMAGFGIGAPVWFAWLATKQIGQNFRLAEDYGFKATVARAYEGYRKEAATLSEDFASRLFESALGRLDESPIRLIDPKVHSSPLQEFLDHPTIRGALSASPNLKEDITNFIRSKLGAAVVGAGAVGSTVSVAAVDAARANEDN